MRIAEVKNVFDGLAVVRLPDGPVIHFWTVNSIDGLDTRLKALAVVDCIFQHIRLRKRYKLVGIRIFIPFAEKDATIIIIVMHILHAREKKEVILESGFSLSEQAHEDDVAPTYVSLDTDEDEESLPSTTSSSVPPPSAAAAVLSGNRDTAHTFIGVDSIEDLRQRVLNDVVGHTNTTTNSTNSNINVDGQSAVKLVSPLEFQAGKPVVLPLVYCDFTASHQPLKSIESYLTQQCLPFYGNTHTNTCFTGSQSTAFCSEARQIVGEYCGAKTTGKASQDVVLFA